MSPSDEKSSSHRRRNPQRTCRGDAEGLTDLHKPLASYKGPVLRSKRSTASQGLKPPRSLRQRKTKKEKQKPQAVNQSVLPDSSACLRESSFQGAGINGHASSESHKAEPVVPQELATPKRQARTSKRSYKRRKIPDTQRCEKQAADFNAAAGNKTTSDKLDSQNTSLEPQTKLSAQTKVTRSRYTKKNKNTPDVPIRTTLRTRSHKEISACHTNNNSTPKQTRFRPSPLLCSTPNSGLRPLSPNRAEGDSPGTPLRPQSLRKLKPTRLPDVSTPRRVRPQRLAAAGRPRGRKKRKVQEQPKASLPIKRCKRSKTPVLESSLGEPYVEPQESVDQNMSSDLSIELSIQKEPNRSPFLQEEEEEDQDDEDEEELPSFLQQGNKQPSSISEGLCVWCKVRKFPYWPAVVKRVNRKSKKASVVFIDGLLIDQKRTRKGFSVSLRTLKPFDCEESGTLADMAKEKYGTAITCSLELISDYRIRIGCGSFVGSFIEYCAADISCPVRRKYSEGNSVLTFPSQEILSEQCINSDDSTQDITVEEHDELLSKKVLPDRTKAARNRANEQLVNFILKKQKVEKRVLAIINGRESSKWLDALLKPTRKIVDVYLEDEEQIDKVYRYLYKVCDSSPQINAFLEKIQTDRISLILDVLFPEAIIYAIAEVHKLTLEKAEEKYRSGPCIGNRERQEFDRMIERQMKRKKIRQHYSQ